MLEKIDEFFNSRLEGYEEHQLYAKEVLKEVGFVSVKLLRRWGAICTIKAVK